MHTRSNKQLILGIIAGLAIGIAGSAIGLGGVAYGQIGGRRAQGKAVYMVGKPSPMQEALGGGMAKAMVDPEFYVLYEDGTIKKETGPF